MIVARDPYGDPVTVDAPPSTRRRAVRAAIWLVVGLFAWFALTALVGAVDWGEVRSAFGELTWVFAVPLVVLLLARQTLNAVPLTYYVPGLGLRRSMQNDLSANIVATFTPPPADLVLRVAMFRSWGVDPGSGLAGIALNTAKFYAVRFLAPTLGIALVAFQGAERRQWLTAILCGLVTVAMLTGLVLVLRGDHLAAWLGRAAGRIVRPFRSSVDPEAWATAMIGVRARSAESLRRGLLPSMLALVGMVLADSFILLTALRGCGVQGLSTVDVLSTFLLAYPLTLFPLFGFGLLDAVLVGTFTTIAGTDQEGAIVAGVVVWRVVTIIGTLLLGAVSVLTWRLSHRDRRSR